MPLGFNSTSHGPIAFGFFHIETDMLLLERLFFWADDFCALIAELAKEGGEQERIKALPGWEITGPENLGDLHGAIGGIHLHGFLGALYRRWPFPRNPGGFCQKPAGIAPRELVLEEMARFGEQRSIQLQAAPGLEALSLGGYGFDEAGVRALLEYVWRGGMPGWQDARRPEYLLQAAQLWSERLEGLVFDPRDVGFRD